MNKIILGAIVFLIFAGILWFKYTSPNISPVQSSQEKDFGNIVQPEVVVQNLDTPWGIAFLPDKSMLVTERPGRVRLGQEIIAELPQVKEISEGGLLGIAIDPGYLTNNYIYLYYTFSGNDNSTLNKVSRFIFKDGKLGSEEVIVDNIPGASNHNGGRIRFGPDGFLYISTGDTQNPSLSQDINSRAGKILRVRDGNVEVYSYGHRNPQGLAWDREGQLWEAEHGQSAHDELNKIIQGENYGWPIIQGDETNGTMVSPVIHSGNITWAPAGIAIIGNSIFFGGLRGQALFEYNTQDKTLTEHFKGQFGRIRDVVVGPDNMLYISTSNQDGRGTPKAGDDKIIRINPQFILDK